MPADGLIAAHSILGETSARSLSPVNGQLPSLSLFMHMRKGFARRYVLLAGVVVLLIY
jgi:hypothetical protein